MDIAELEIDPWIEEKLWTKHRVDVAEVEEVCFEDEDLRLEHGRAGLYLLLGRTAAGRYLATVLAPKGSGRWKIVTARDMTDTERRRYRRS